MSRKHLIPGLLALAAAGAAALSSVPAYTQAAAAAGAQSHFSKHRVARSAAAEDEGQRIFEQNCSRCHNAPEGFSPRISGTIIRHMRVRANLSQHDAEILFRYFNP